MSGRRWGIGIVTVVAAVATALASAMATIVVLYTLCEPGQHGPGSTADELCDTTAGAGVFLAYFALPTLTVIVAGIAGVKKQRWRILWLGLGFALAILVVAGIVLGNVSTTA